uniref:Uncharacterized protein n=1 Tax=Rhizophora mucronata TaxID=61149 RepID=A0A2P2PFA9_RHIMU
MRTIEVQHFTLGFWCLIITKHDVALESSKIYVESLAEVAES